MPRGATERTGRRVVSMPDALARVEAKMAALAAETYPPGLGPVFGEGNPASPLVLVGEAPGEREVAEGYPFAGPAGRLLDGVLAEIGLRREQFWLTNLLKCRPVREERGRLTNRAPLAGEIKAWLPLLMDELEVIRPRLLACLGATSARALLGKDFKLTAQRGQWLEGPLGTQAMATFHPAYILHLEPYDAAAGRAAREALKLDLTNMVARLGAAGPPSHN